MANISDQFASELMAHSIDLGRFEAHEASTLLKLFRDLERELIAQLKRVDPTEPTLTVYQRRRADALLAHVRTVIRDAYRQMYRTEAADLRQLAMTEAAFVQELGAEIVVDGLFSVGVPESTLRALVTEGVIEGKPLKDWWAKQATTTLERYGDAVRSGVVRGDSINAIVQTLRGTRERQFQDGVFSRSKRDIQTLVRTSVNSVSSSARLEVFKANEDVLKGWEWLTALDSNVCVIYCAPLSGQAWTLEGQRMPGTKMPYPGPPPRHP